MTFITYRIPPQPFFTEQQPTKSDVDDHLQEQLECTREENRRLKEHLVQLNDQLQEYRTRFDLFKEKLFYEGYNRSKQAFEAEQIQRLRHELDVYHQITIAKRREEDKHLYLRDFISTKKFF